MEPLAKLNNLTQLSLDIFYGNRTVDLRWLAKLNNLTQLSLDLDDSEVKDWGQLAKLSNLTQLSLDLEYSEVSNLEPLSRMTRLREISIVGATKAQRMSLRDIPASLVELRF